MRPENARQPRLLAYLLFGADLFIVCFAYLVAFRIRTGLWNLVAFDAGLGPALGFAVFAYMIALFASGIYMVSPRKMHLPHFMRVAGALLIAWPASVTLAYLLARNYIPPRSVTVVHWMLSLIGVLGLRALLRRVLEWRRHLQPLELASTSAAPVTIYDLFDREPIEIDKTRIQNHLSSRTVLVTGAGGSIGSELCRLLVDLQPFRLVMVDVSEYNLYQLENALRGQAFTGDLVFRIADVRDEEIMRTVFSTYRPDVIFHAAAYKHVPLMERHPIEAFRNNTLTTISLLRLCEIFETEQLIFVSTDKAVHPTSVLGATKRIAEWYLRAAHSPIKRKIVRFGNVFGSQGSVVELFQQQLADGESLTVTHPDMERYFMSAEEACGLILETMLLTAEAPVFMLRMGEPVKIDDLAHRLIERCVPHVRPEHKIVYTGIRPGEKMNEELMSETEHPIQTAHPAIFGLTSPPPYSRSELDTFINHLTQLCKENRTEELRKALFQTEFERVRSTTHF